MALTDASRVRVIGLIEGMRFWRYRWSARRDLAALLDVAPACSVWNWQPAALR